MINLSKTNIVDLSHTFFPGIPHAEDMPDETTKKIYDFEKDGFQAHYYGFAGQWGTHIDVPVHFVQGGRTLEEIRPNELVLPLVVINCVKECSENPDYLLDTSKIDAFEKQYGKIPLGAFVAMRSDWSSRWPDPIKMSNKDSAGISHFPGWSVEAAKFLIEERAIGALGHEPTDTDGGKKVSADNFECEDFILQKDIYQIELLASLSEVPAIGAIVFVGFPKSKDGSGFPVRVLALNLVA